MYSNGNETLCIGIMNTKENRSGKALICLCGVLYAANFWYRASFGPILDVLQSEFHATSGQIGLMTALFWFGYVLLQIPSGLLLQSVTVEFTIIVSTLLFAVTTLLFAVPFNVESIILPSGIMILSGIATAPVFLASTKLIARRSGPNAVPFVGGIIQLLAAAVQALGNMLQAFLWQKHGIWREMYFGCSMLTLLLFVGLYVFGSTKTAARSNERTLADIIEKDFKKYGFTQCCYNMQIFHYVYWCILSVFLSIFKELSDCICGWIIYSESENGETVSTNASVAAPDTCATCTVNTKPEMCVT